MTLPGYLALVGLLTAAGWAVFLLARATNWVERALLGALAGVVVIGHLLPLVSEVESWSASPLGAGTWSDAGVSAVSVLAVLLLGRVLGRARSLRLMFSGQLDYLITLFETVQEAVALLDEDGNLYRANRAFGGMFGYADGQVPGGDLQDFLIPRDRAEEFREVIRRVMAGEQVARTLVCLRKDQKRVDVSLVGGPLRVVGLPARGFLLIRDITRMMEVEGTFRHFEKALEQTQVGITITDLSGTIIYTNPADAAMHGYTVEEVIGGDVRMFAPSTLAKPLSVVQLEELGRWGRETLNVRKDGGVFPVQLLSDVVRNAADEPIGVVTSCLDITERKVVEKALMESEARYALALRGASEGLWDWNLETDEVFYSKLWKSMLGFDDEEIGNRLSDWLDRVHPEDLGRLEEGLEAHRDGEGTLEEESPRLEVEHRAQCKDGEYRWFLARGIAERGPDGVPYRMAGSLTDITVRKDVEEGLAREALYDGLTGLPNRTFFLDLLARTYGQVRRRGGFTFAILFMDLDRFKVVNDTFGHAAGDELLIEVARRVEDTIRPGDIAARFGGDEFCLLLDDLHDPRDATRVARRVQEALVDPIQIQGRDIHVSASIGIAISDEDLKDGETLLRNADVAMYRSKGQGDSTVEVFDRHMHEQAMEQLEMESALGTALESGEFQVAYQPVVHLGDEAVIGFEALLRWIHPEKGAIGPAEFIQLAEDTGLIVAIGDWVFRRACKQLLAWQRDFPILGDAPVSVNVSLKQLQQPDFVDGVERLLSETGLAPRNLQVEISEKILMADPDYHAELIRGLRDLGVLVQLDDFGTGATSLVYLADLAVDSVKIDRAFIGSMGFAEGREGMVQSMIALARDMGIPAIAEGIETAAQASRLLSLQCERGQGFLFYEPLEPRLVEALLERKTAEKG